MAENAFKADWPSFALGFNTGKSKGGGGTPEGFHMVRFFNDDRTTLLYTVFVPTGASAIYAGETPISTINSTLMFFGFEPSAVNVTEDMDCYATYDFVITNLNETSWEQISALSELGTAQNHFAIGDVKMIHIEGMVGTLKVNGDYGVYIIGFDHNEAIEGKGIHFGTFKNDLSDGVDICLTGSNYNYLTDNKSKVFNINHYKGTNKGGWNGCDLRYDILGSTDVEPTGYIYGSSKTGYDATPNCASEPVAGTLMAALPADLRAVMKPMTKYTNNVGGYPEAENGITAGIDYLPLPSAFEITGNSTDAHPDELGKQKQYAYYKTSSSIVKYKDSSVNTAAWWWLRSPSRFSGSSFLLINMSGQTESFSVGMPYGLAPIFKV